MTCCRPTTERCPNEIGVSDRLAGSMDGVSRSLALITGAEWRLQIHMNSISPGSSERQNGMQVSIAELSYEQLRESDYAAASDLLHSDYAAGAEMLNSLENSPKDIMAVFLEDKLVALADVGKPEEQSFLSVFVDLKHRRQGIGSTLVNRVEQELGACGTRRIVTCFRSDNEIARTFARKHGYTPYFSSAKMERTGGSFRIEPLPIRLYTDNDYYACQALSAKAFHEMRLRVGSFPDSTIAQPSENGRKSWLENAENTYVYLDNGEIAACGTLFGNEIESVSVRTDYQGRGIGRRLVMFLCNEILMRGHDAVALWCVVGNYARHLYERLGFTETYTAEYPRKIL